MVGPNSPNSKQIDELFQRLSEYTPKGTSDDKLRTFCKRLEASTVLWRQFQEETNENLFPQITEEHLDTLGKIQNNISNAYGGRQQDYEKKHRLVVQFEEYCSAQLKQKKALQKELSQLERDIETAEGIITKKINRSNIAPEAKTAMENLQSVIRKQKESVSALKKSNSPSRSDYKKTMKNAKEAISRELNQTSKQLGKHRNFFRRVLDSIARLFGGRHQTKSEKLMKKLAAKLKKPSSTDPSSPKPR